MPWSSLVWRGPSFQCRPLLSVTTTPVGRASSEVVTRLRFSVCGLLFIACGLRLVACGLLLGVGGLLQDPLDLTVSSDPELSPSKQRDEEGEVTELDHFTFLQGISGLELLCFLEPRKDDVRGLTKVWDPSCSAKDKGFPQ